MTKWSSNSYQHQGPTLEDCERLWTTIKKEMITDCQLEIILPTFPIGGQRPVLVVKSPGLDSETGSSVDRLWATRELSNNSLGFTYQQLYDLLIEAYRRIEGRLGGQESF